MYVANLSYGKDSIAMLHVIVDILHKPLDRIVTAEVWATDTIPADLPPMVEFKAKADAEIKRRWGIEVEHFCALNADGSKRTYEQMFYHVPVHKKKLTPQAGGGYFFPTIRVPWCNSELKRAALQRISATARTMVHQTKVQLDKFYSAPEAGATIRPTKYIGIAADEPKRIERHKDKPGFEMPLVEAGWTEQTCRDWCESNGLLSPIYTGITKRGGCWFCHNQGVPQLRELRKNYPDLWALMLKWDSDSPVTFKPDGHTVHDYDKRFAMEEQGYFYQEDFRWRSLDAAQTNIFQALDGKLR